MNKLHRKVSQFSASYHRMKMVDRAFRERIEELRQLGYLVSVTDLRWEQGRVNFIYVFDRKRELTAFLRYNSMTDDWEIKIWLEDSVQARQVLRANNARHHACPFSAKEIVDSLAPRLLTTWPITYLTRYLYPY